MPETAPTPNRIRPPLSKEELDTLTPDELSDKILYIYGAKDDHVLTPYIKEQLIVFNQWVQASAADSKDRLQLDPHLCKLVYDRAVTERLYDTSLEDIKRSVDTKESVQEKWERENNGVYANRKALYVDNEYFKILKEKGPLEASRYRKVKQVERHNSSTEARDKPEFLHGGAATAHRQRRDKIFTEIKESRVEEFIPQGGFRAGEEVELPSQRDDTIRRNQYTNESGPVNTDEDISDARENPYGRYETPENLGEELSTYGKKEFMRLIVNPHTQLHNDPHTQHTIYKIVRNVVYTNLLEDISKSEKIEVENHILNYLPRLLMEKISGNISEDATQQIARNIVSIAHKDIGYTRAGGRRLEVVETTPYNINNPERENSYADILQGVGAMQTTAALTYHRKLTGDPNAEIPVGQEFDKLTKKWAKWQQALYYAAIYSLPAAGAIGVGIATGGLSWWAHGLAVAAGLGGGVLASAAANKAGSKSGSHLRDIQLLGGLKELKKGLTSEGYLEPPKYNVAHEALRSLFGKTPQRSIRHLNITRGALSYILKRGETNVENVQKKTRIVMTIMSLLAGGFTGHYYHGDGVVEALNQPNITPTAPPTPEPLVGGDITELFRDWWSNSISEVFTFDGTGPKLGPAKIPNCCWNPTTL